MSGHILHIEKFDIPDGTPLPDIKPYIPAFEAYKTAKCGWMNQNTNDSRKTKAEDRV